MESSFMAVSFEEVSGELVAVVIALFSFGKVEAEEWSEAVQA